MMCKFVANAVHWTLSSSAQVCNKIREFTYNHLLNNHLYFKFLRIIIFPSETKAAFFFSMPLDQNKTIGRPSLNLFVMAEFVSNIDPIEKMSEKFEKVQVSLSLS